MCGIAGGNLFTIDTIKESLDDTKHRGYDEQQVFEDGDVVLGHNRLSIQDLSETANQPFTDSTGRYTIVYNGELWKSMLKYRNELEKKYNFITENSDTELLLYMFIEYGVEVFQILDGMFSFAIYDKEEHIDFRVGYIEDSGQLCLECYEEIYIKSKTKKENEK